MTFFEKQMMGQERAHFWVNEIEKDFGMSTTYVDPSTHEQVHDTTNPAVDVTATSSRSCCGAF